MNIPVNTRINKGSDAYGDSKLYERLRTLREQHGYTQESLAEALNVNPQAVKKWEYWKNPSDPKLKNLLALCELYNCDLDHLIGRIGPRTHDIKTVCEITGLSEKAVEKITSVKPYRDMSDLLPTDYMEVNGHYELTKEGMEKVKTKEPSYSNMVRTLSKLIETDRFSGLIMAYKKFLDSAAQLKDSKLDEPSYVLNDNETVVLSRAEATRHFMRNVSDEITFICESEYSKQYGNALKNRKKNDKDLFEEVKQNE